jgi:hypothetical protein
MRAGTVVHTFYLFTLCALFATQAVQASDTETPSAATWQQRTWSDHRARVDDYVALIAKVNADAGVPESDAETKAVVEELVDASHEPLSRTDLVGTFQLRSIQGTRYGIFAYPYFKARIVERDGGLFFEKVSGSQRRSGWLLPRDENGHDYVFVGASTVNADPQQRYSRDTGAPAPAESDSVGVLYRINDGRLVMVLDAGANSYEIYQLKR